MAPSMFIPGIEEASSTYEEIWKQRDETENFQQKYDAELIKELKRSVVFVYLLSRDMNIFIIRIVYLKPK